MLLLSYRVIISTMLFIVGVMAGRRMVIESKRLSQNQGQEKPTTISSGPILIISLLVGISGVLILHTLPDADLFGLMFAIGLIAPVIGFVIQKVVFQNGTTEM